MSDTSAETPLSCTCNVAYVAAAATAKRSSLFIVKEENTIYLHESAPAHALGASLTHHHVTSHFQGKIFFSSSLTDLQYIDSLALLDI